MKCTIQGLLALPLALAACEGSPVIVDLSPTHDAQAESAPEPGRDAAPDVAAPTNDAGVDAAADADALDAGASDDAAPWNFSGGSTCPIHWQPGVPAGLPWVDGGLLCTPDAAFLVQDPDSGALSSCWDHSPACPSGWECAYRYGSYGIESVCP